ncbi:hypothetical protein T07_4626 [Trichinella nelsoni]|uniref:Uncharacterized protein n=1 Tax=Trichinella nelsoni TaxID=6336 RepID=A0A0V0SI71_9BILA|nr:hypothetical protein T07_4626 [Trichinella nelsoni]
MYVCRLLWNADAHMQLRYPIQTAYARQLHRAIFTIVTSIRVCTDTDQANNCIPPENEAEKRESYRKKNWTSRSEAEYGRTDVRGCLVVGVFSENLSVLHRHRKAQAERKGNLPVNTGPSPNSDGHAKNTMEKANEPDRGSGSSHLVGAHTRHLPSCSAVQISQSPRSIPSYASYAVVHLSKLPTCWRIY